MDINLLSFGQAADITGREALKISEVKDTEELKKYLSKTWPLLQSLNYSLAVNKNIVRENTPLEHEDTVAILPPFSGG